MYSTYIFHKIVILFDMQYVIANIFDFDKVWVKFSAQDCIENHIHLLKKMFFLCGL